MFLRLFTVDEWRTAATRFFVSARGKFLKHIDNQAKTNPIF
jgi:hypothetical protein